MKPAIDQMIAVADLRKALSPVEDWFDWEGEEHDPVSVVDAVKDVSEMLVEDRKDCLRLRKALREIVEHQETNGFELQRLLAIGRIAREALDKR